MKRALEDTRYETIKAHFIDPEHSTLSKFDQELLERVVSMARLLNRYPIQKNAVALHMKKYPDIGRSQAYEDCRMAMKLFNTMYSFDYDFWHTWLINDIVKNIERCQKSDDPKDRRNIAQEHYNLIKALGEKPNKEIDPKLMEAHTFIIPVQINNTQYNFDLQKFLDLPDALRKKVADALISDIKEIEAAEIMKS
jgi:hypothetical protein